jgi:hypothetical protein
VTLPLRQKVATAAALVALLGGVVGLQAAREHLQRRPEPVQDDGLLYVRAPEFMVRSALSFKSVAADVYWIRALQHYGRTRLSQVAEPRYDLLYPFLDLATSLDVRFSAAYRFGAIFLTEPPPGGPGRPDLAIALLEKGLRAEPRRWEYAQDVGFVHYRSGDYPQAAHWFRTAAAIDGAPRWMLPLAAVTEAQGGQRATSRQLWTTVLEGITPDDEWLRVQAELRIQQLDALDDIDALHQIARRVEQQTGRAPSAWREVVQAGALGGVPRDPRGFPYQLHAGGLVTLDARSTLNPLPVAGQGR